MASELTPAQERFAAEVARGLSYSAAYRIAYPASLKWAEKTVWSRASEMAADGKVAGRVAELKAPALQAAQYDVHQAMRETDNYLEQASQDRAWGPVASMLKHKAQLNGLLLQKVEVGGVGEFGHFTAQDKVAARGLLEQELARRKALAADVTDVVSKGETPDNAD